MISWKHIFAGLLCLISLLGTASAHAGEAPSSVDQPPQQASQPAQPTAGRPLRRILVAESVESAIKLTPSTDSGFVVLAPAFSSLNLPELTKRLTPGENQIITDRLLAAIAQVVEVFFRQNDYPAATVIVPSQNIAGGEVRVIVFLGKIRNINFQGTRWFSESLLRQKLSIEQGNVIRFSELDRAISWTNNNPFRRVHITMNPVANTGEADLVIAVQEAIPLRLTLSSDNSGNPFIGKNRHVASVSYANLWGLDHQVAYQFITTDKPRFFKGHGFDYRVPLPWRHFVQFSSSYIRARPEFYEGLFVQEGETITADLRYTLPLRTGDNPAEVFASLSFKQSNNNLAFGGTAVQATKTDIFQFTTGGSIVRRDKRGAWVLGATLTLSPGGINSRNTTAAFDGERHGGQDSARYGANAAYIYASLTCQRLLNLGAGWDLFSRGVVQVSQANLLASEQLNIGGAATVRGFRESTFNGDHGFVVSNDLLTPSWKKPLPWLSKTRGPLEVRPLAFIDVGHTGVRHRFYTDPRRHALIGSGLGLRVSLASNFSLTADYGWRLSPYTSTSPERSRAHVRASLAF